jgi:general secretion pathway protein G
MQGNLGWRGSDERGFSLIELLVVMVVLGLLVALVGPKLFGHVGKSKLKAAQAQIELFGTALDSYRLDVGKYPTTEEGIEALQRDTGVKGWAGSYLKKEIPEDPWNRSYFYRSPGEHGDYDLFTYGADGSVGGEGENRDVVSWKGLG